MLLKSPRICRVFYLVSISSEVVLNWHVTNPMEKMTSSLPGLTVMLKYTLDSRRVLLISIMLIKKHVAWLKPKMLICNACYLHKNISQENVW